MPRLFVAIRPPAAMRACLLSPMGGIAGARWQHESQLHLTLRFIGEVDGAQAEDIASELGAIGGRYRPSLAIEGVGAFASKGRVTSLWAAVRPDAEIERLRRAVDRALIRCGLAPESRAFRPHVTLARLPRSAGSTDRWIAENAGLGVPATIADAVGLYQSHLGATGAHYALAMEYPLA